jgi:hypothetical protein
MRMMYLAICSQAGVRPQSKGTPLLNLDFERRVIRFVSKDGRMKRRRRDRSSRASGRSCRARLFQVSATEKRCGAPAAQSRGGQHRRQLRALRLAMQVQPSRQSWRGICEREGRAQVVEPELHRPLDKVARRQPISKWRFRAILRAEKRRNKQRLVLVLRYEGRGRASEQRSPIGVFGTRSR